MSRVSQIQRRRAQLRIPSFGSASFGSASFGPFEELRAPPSEEFRSGDGREQRGGGGGAGAGAGAGAGVGYATREANCGRAVGSGGERVGDDRDALGDEVW